MLYGKPTKYIRHVDENTITLEPQRFYVHTFWRYDQNSPTARTDGLDLQDERVCPEGSKILSHRVEMLVTPETIEPQQLYIGTLALSFADVYHHSICGGRFDQASYLDTATENFDQDGTNPITPHLYANVQSDKIEVLGADTANQEIGGSGSGYGISEWKLDDHIKHWIRLKKVTVFDQRPLVSDRKQPIPSKVKRINEGTFYGIFFFNDAVRGATPADTQVKINIKSNWTEMAI